jgi:hypothetical protein
MLRASQTANAILRKRTEREFSDINLPKDWVITIEEPWRVSCSVMDLTNSLRHNQFDALNAKYRAILVIKHPHKNDTPT